MASGTVTADQVRDMLGLADRGRIRRLLETVLAGDAAATLAELDEAHALGIDPGALLRGLMEALHAGDPGQGRRRRRRAAVGRGARGRRASSPARLAGARSTACGRCC